MPWISFAIAELEQDRVDLLWEPPIAFESMRDFSCWVLYGKKGCGKSTIVAYWEAKPGKHRVTVIRPAAEDTFYELLAAFVNANTTNDKHLLERRMTQLLDTVVTISLMKDWYVRNSHTVARGDEALVYQFLQSIGAIESSALARAIKFIEVALEGHAKMSFSKYLEETGKPTFTVARDAYFRLLARQGTDSLTIACIDDIDDVLFSFGEVDRVFIDALLSYTVEANTKHFKNQVPLRIILTCPSELYYHRELWGGDKVASHAVVIRWSDPERLKQLVNKRIALKLDVRKRQPRESGDVYSIESANTWNRAFPEHIVNRLELRESAFEYVLRHTFYTPRDVLNVLDAIHDDPQYSVCRPDDVSDLGTRRWSELFQRIVTEQSQHIVASFIGIYNQIYEGLPHVLTAFRERPNVWAHRQLEDFILSEKLSLRRRDSSDLVVGESLIATLYKIGFLGLATEDASKMPKGGSRYYSTRYSFLRDTAIPGSWDIALVAPVFYDALRVHSWFPIIVAPHSRLLLDQQSATQLGSYSHALNAFY